MNTLKHDLDVLKKNYNMKFVIDNVCHCIITILDKSFKDMKFREFLYLNTIMNVHNYNYMVKPSQSQLYVPNNVLIFRNLHTINNSETYFKGD